MSKVEQVRLAVMIINIAKNKPETLEEVIALIEKIIKKLKLED